MNDSSTPQAYMSVDFGEHGGRYEWSTHEEAISWVSQLQSDWSWVQQGQNPTPRAWKAISNPLANVLNFLQQAWQYHQQGQTQNADNQVASASSTLESSVRTTPWLLPNSAQRRFVETLRDGGKPLEAAMIVSQWLGMDFAGAPIPPVVSGLLQWELYERGIKDRMETENAVLKGLAGDMQTALTHYREAERAQTARFDSLHGQIVEQTTEQQNAFDAGQQDRSDGWKSQVDAAQTELDLIKKTYDEHMTLAAPVEYWEAKRRKHRLWSGISFAAIAIGMGTAAISLHAELQSVGKAVTAGKAATAAAGAKVQASGMTALQTISDSATTWHLGSFILLATLSFWFIRLLVRIFLSNLHLENDAAERVTMAKTYLALSRNDALPKGDNISTVLAALFRPTGDGIVKDEGVPPSTLEWFTKLR